MAGFYAFVRFPNESELKQNLEANGSGLSVTDFQQSGGLQWLGNNGITPGSIGFELAKGERKFLSVSMLPRSDFGTGSLDVDLVQRFFLSDGVTENKKKFVKYETAPFHNTALEKAKDGFTFGVHLDGQEVTKSLSAQEVQKMFPSLGVDKIAEFEAHLNAGSSADFLSQSVAQFSTLAEGMKAMIVQSRPITDWKEYQTHLPVFLELNQQYVDLNGLFGVLGMDLKTTIEKYSAQAVEQGGKVEASEALNDLVQRGKQASLNDFSKALAYDLQELERIKRTLESHDAVMNNLQNINHPASKRMLLEGLYKDSVELYLKALREIYSRVKRSDDYGNEEMYKFFKEHPPLWDSPINTPRNDFMHRTFEVYDDWSDEDLHKGANVILVRFLTGIIAKYVYLANMFKQIAPTISLGLKELDKNKLGK